ncbi:MAG: HD domain-containing protein [Rhizobiales bacterium]|nr:LuxR C-terminal-related transcriptional regulator [Hyphomicrobiales bacterium]NRB14513.1 HD domain-containing protein [Hyphomicrobiales bacterium]
MANITEGLATLAIAADIATGRPKGSGLTAAIVAVELAKKLGLNVEQQKDAFYLASVRFIGCTITSNETSLMAIGDDQGFAVATMLGDWADKQDLKNHLDRFVALDDDTETRDKAFDFICDILPDAAPDFTAAHCEQAYLLAKRLPVSEAVLHAIPYYYARYDGKILPFGGEDVPYLSRLVRVSEMAELVRRLDTNTRAKEVIKAKLGHELDPNIGAIFLQHADEIFKIASVTPEFETYIAAEPGEPIKMTPTCRQTLSEVGADMIDHKSTHFQSHSRRVSSLTSAAAQIANLPADKIDNLRLAALVHDIGKCAISNRIWNKATELSGSELLEMQGHTYQTEYILSHGKPFNQFSSLSSAVQERADGSGYHRGQTMSDLACNILAAANEYDELTHSTPARKAYTPEKATEILTKAATDKKFLPTAVTAVLQAAGHNVRLASQALPFGITRRESQVLSGLMKSETTAQIAESLHISPKTADHHIQSIYNKTGVRARPALTLFALEHGIVME